MKCLIVRRVKYRFPCRKKVGWAMVLAEKFGLALLWVPKLDDQRDSDLVIAEENVSHHFFEDSGSSQFPLEPDDLVKLGVKLQTVGGEGCDSELAQLFQPEPEDSF